MQVVKIHNVEEPEKIPELVEKILDLASHVTDRRVYSVFGDYLEILTKDNEIYVELYTKKPVDQDQRLRPIEVVANVNGKTVRIESYEYDLNNEIDRRMIERLENEAISVINSPLRDTIQEIVSLIHVISKPAFKPSFT